MTTQTQETPSADVQIPATRTGVPGDDLPQDEQRPNREAKYRVERNEAREALSAAQTRIADLQTKELHRLAGQHLAAPEDIELSGKTLADYLTPEGWVDHDAVADAAADVIESRPGLAKNPRVPAVDRSQGKGNGDVVPTPQWSDMFTA